MHGRRYYTNPRLWLRLAECCISAHVHRYVTGSLVYTLHRHPPLAWLCLAPALLILPRACEPPAQRLRSRVPFRRPPMHHARTHSVGKSHPCMLYSCACACCCPDWRNRRRNLSNQTWCARWSAKAAPGALSFRRGAPQVGTRSHLAPQTAGSRGSQMTAQARGHRLSASSSLMP